MLSEEEIMEILASSDLQENKIKKMMALSLERGGRDNITILLVAF